MKINFVQYLNVVVFALVLSELVYAQDELKKTEKSKTATVSVKGIWDGSVEYGIIATTGNTNTRSESAKVSVKYQNNFWLNSTVWSFLKASDSGVISADQTLVRNNTRYTINNNDYIYLALNYEADRFSGFNSRTSEVVGYGFSIIKKNNIDWNVELGIGARQSSRTDGKKQDNSIYSAGTNAFWKINDNSQISEVLFMEKGNDNTYIESSSTIKLKINGSLSLNLNLKIKNNSNVPDRVKRTDTQTTVNIVYDF